MKTIKKSFLVCATLLSANSIMSVATAMPRLNWQSADFEGRRVIAESAWKTEDEAKRRGDFLYSKYHFQNLGVLWIPSFENLSGKRLYQTVIVPEGNCDRFLNRYSNKIDRNAYCLNPSNQGIPADRRGMRD
jgi:hypothetical protein